MGLYDFTVYDLIQRNAVSFADQPAWFEVDDNRTLNFAQCKQNVDHLACGLQQAGITAGDRIGIVGKNSLEYFLLYGAAAAVGAVMVPINWRLSADEVAYNLADVAPRIVFFDPEFLDLAGSCKRRLSAVTEYFCLKDHKGDLHAFQDLMNNSAAVQPVEVSHDDGYIIIHTAAVAGKPRGAVLSQGNLMCAGLHLICCMGISPADVHLNLLPMFHIGGLMMVAASFMAGALNVNMSKFDAVTALKLIEEKKASLMFDFSPILGAILKEQERTGADITSLRAVMGLEAPETIEKYQQVSNGIFYCLYGQTETSGLVSMGRYNERPGSAGKMIPLGDVRLVDENGRPSAVGQVGEITLKGPMVFKGYWNLPQDNDHIFRDNRHHTGDLGRFDEQGFLWYAGRKPEKELIKPGGENVYPAEVEQVILQHPAVEHTVVFGVPDSKWKEAVKAVCVLKTGHTLASRELIDFVGQRIARYKKPQYVEFLTDLPMLESGIPDRARIKSMYGGDQK
jgi:acyl-CoA synthetase (AMP-forming)/AMP-acid ligase II